MAGDPNQLKQAAEWLRMCLKWGIRSKADVIAWADDQVAVTMTLLNVSVVLLLFAPVLGLLLLMSSAFPALERSRVALKWLAIAALVLGLAGILCFGAFGLGFV